MKRPFVAAALAIALAGSLTSASAAQAQAPSTDAGVWLTIPPVTAVVESVDLGGGMRLQRTAADALVIAPVGATLTVAQGPAGPELAVEVPDPDSAPTPGWTLEQTSDVLDRVRAGETFEQIAASFPNVGPMGPNYEDTYNYTCVDKTADYGKIKVCTNRAVGSDNGTTKYVGAKSYTFGQVQPAAANQYNMRRIDIADGYPHSSQHVVDFQPGGTVYKTDNCDSVSIGIASQGVSLSLTKPICPKQMTPLLNEVNGLTTTWYGKEDGSANSMQIDLVKSPSGTGSPMHFHGSVQYQPKCSGILCSLPFFD